MKREEIHIRDPFVYVENGKYYLLGTTGDDPWGKASDLTLYVSDDLENYDKVCTMVTDGSLDEYTNIWAPELHKYHDAYYLIVSALKDDIGRGSMIFSSKNLDGNFKMLTGEYVTPKGWGCLDATLFVYEDKPYLCFSNEWLTPINGNGDGSLFIAKMSDDLKTLSENPVRIVSGRKSEFAVEIGDKIKGVVAEGPFLYQEGKDIVLLWSTYTETGYAIIKSVSKTGIYGEYVFDKILFDKDGGHCMRFTDLKGKNRITFHQPNKTPFERMKLFED